MNTIPTCSSCNKTFSKRTLKEGKCGRCRKANEVSNVSEVNPQFYIEIDNDMYCHPEDDTTFDVVLSDSPVSLDRGLSDEKRKRKNIPKKVRDALWRRDCGNLIDSVCYVCNGRMSYSNFEAGHILSAKNGGTDDLSNLRAICMNCNRGMGAEHIEDYKERRFGRISKEESFPLQRTGHFHSYPSYSV